MLSTVSSDVGPGPAPAKGTGPSSCHFIVHTTAEATGLLEQFAAELCAAGYSARDVFCMRLAVEEALVNGIRHGNQCDPCKSVEFTYHIGPDQVVVSVEDQGPGFDPAELPDPLDVENLERSCGRGVFLMRQYMTWVEFNERGNRVTLGKRRQK
jgi:serine/threonine-protein kinase RsbW